MGGMLILLTQVTQPLGNPRGMALMWQALSARKPIMG